MHLETDQERQRTKSAFADTQVMRMQLIYIRAYIC